MTVGWQWTFAVDPAGPEPDPAPAAVAEAAPVAAPWSPGPAIYAVGLTKNVEIDVQRNASAPSSIQLPLVAVAP
jgi:hypothetical protein